MPGALSWPFIFGAIQACILVSLLILQAANKVTKVQRRPQNGPIPTSLNRARHPQFSRIKGAFTAFEPKLRALIRKSVFGVRVDMGTAAAAEAYTLVNTAVPA